jgi:hypothetical protein
LLGLIGGALLGTWLSQQLSVPKSDLPSVLLGALGMLSALAFVRRRFGQAGGRRYQAVVLRVVPGAVTTALRVRA